MFFVHLEMLNGINVISKEINFRIFGPLSFPCFFFLNFFFPETNQPSAEAECKYLFRILRENSFSI